jgi:dissimilatory sulfite reductase related protein
MPTIRLGNKELVVDGDGFLTEPEKWNEEIARFLAKADGTGELTDNHWVIINYIRHYWKEKDNAPIVRSVCQNSNLRLKQFYKLFPMGPAKGACKIAGLPKPEGCI